MPQDGAGDQVAILLSIHNGERFLADQLESFAAQTHRNWTVFWRDDGSQDAGAAIVQRFSEVCREGSAIRVSQPSGQLGVTNSYLHLLRATGEAPIVAFADQDDVWLPDKLARGLRALTNGPASLPALYCARQVLVDAELRRIGLSNPLRRPPGFLAALTQNIATGCTVMMNSLARDLIAQSAPPPVALHDWWSYLLVAGAGGRIVVDTTPTVLYRQHGGNLVGAPGSVPRRAIIALRRGPHVFMGVFRAHVASLLDQPHLLCASTRGQLAIIASALERRGRDRAMALRLPGLYRQTALETLLFRLWFMLG
jgi:glycosyltransferase involved in cell wall biosynthesis